MDYTRSPLSFRARKAFRYVRLYGPRRTLNKVESQYHMRRRYSRPLELAIPTGPALDADVGIIGCGNFAYSHIAYFLHRNFGPVIRSTMDLELDRAASLAKRYGAHSYGDDAESMLTDPAVRVVFVASNHASHAEYAIRALEAGKSVHIEKPHVVGRHQLERLCEAMERSPGRVNLGFNRPSSRLGVEIRRVLADQSGPAVLSWFVAGHELPPGHWYLRPEEGGRVLGNLCHWSDFVYRMVDEGGRYPITITPTRATRPDVDIAVTYAFGDGSIASIAFTEAKGHAFEGVTERFAAQRGEALVALDDFDRLVVQIGPKKKVTRLLHRDHGHERTIVASYHLGWSNEGCGVRDVWESAELFLETKRALEERATTILTGFTGRVAADG